jgi:hypothetical protein
MSQDEQGSGLELASVHDQWLMAQGMVRAYAASELRNLIEMLKPSIDGSYGPVNPRMVEVFMTALRDLGRLYRVHDAPPAPPPESGLDEGGSVDMGELRSRVLDSLAELEGRRPGS